MLASGSLVGVAALAAVLTAPPAVADDGPTGSAYAVSAATTLLNQPAATVPARPAVTYPGGGTDALAKVGPNLAGLVTATALNASSVRKGRVLASSASIADVTVNDILTATVVEAECSASPTAVTGRSSVADLTVLGQEVDVSQPREIDVLGVAKVRIGEQVRTGDTLTVNAVHVIVGGPVGNVTSADIVLSQAKCTWRGATQPTTPTAPPTQPTTTTPRPSTTGTTTTTTTTTTTATTTTRRPTTTTEKGVENAASEEDLAETGVSAVLPISLAGLLLLVGGGSALLVARRRRNS